MQKDRWKEITRIFHAALDLPPELRPGFVCTAASGDPDLQSEVERLLLADRQADSYLESPLIPAGAFAAALSDEPQLRPGDVLCQRFHILRAVGSGGMGQVFEAHDSELAVNVALKLIRPEIAANPQALARFRQEVRLARRITHPNVCRTFDLDRDTLTTPEGPPRTLVFLTMEFLAGETLAARLKRSGRLTPEEILAIARQIAAALDAAHAIGVVHRDIKPGNIMLVPAGENSRQPARVVITDFGLARIDPVFSQDENSITQHSSHSAHPIGTLAYMAPEQMDGRPISAATDIYAFGLLLFEMATGQRAFPSSNLLSGIAQRLSGPPPSPTSLQPSLPKSFEQAIQGCLRLKPEDRFQSAQAVMDCLECLTGQSQPLSSPSISAINPQPRSRRWTNWMSRSAPLSAAATLLLAVSLFLLGLRYQWWEGNAKLDPGALVYLAPVTNQTGEKSLDNITELLQASLEQSAHINLLDQGRVGDILQNMTKPADTPIDRPTGREIGMRANAARVIFAQVTGSQGHYTLNIDIQRTDYYPGRFRDHWTNHFDWQTTGNTNSSVQSGAIPQELTTTLRNSTDWIRNKVGESKDDVARLDTPPEEATTASWEALEDYTNAELFASKREPEKALLALRDAIHADPNFALAYARLGDLLFSLNRSTEGYEAYVHALSADYAHKLTRKERDFIKGSYAVDTWDFASAESAFRDYAAYYENDYAGVFFRAYPLRMLGRIAEAVDVLKRAQELAPSESGTYLGLGYDYMLQGDWQNARQSAARLHDLHFSDEEALLAGHLDFLGHDYQQSRRDFEAMKVSQTVPHRSLSYSLVARVEAEQGQIDDAVKSLRLGIEYDRSHSRHSDEAAKYMDEAYLECRRSDISSCVQDTLRATNLDSRPEMILRGSSALGTALAHSKKSLAGALKAPLRQLKHSLGSIEYGPIYTMAQLRLNGELELAEGDTASALKEFRKVEIIDSPITDRDYLARALTAAANAERNPTVRKKLQEEALAAYDRSVGNPASVWYYSPHYPPGFLADQMEDYLNLAISMAKRDKVTLQTMEDLGRLRGSRHAIP